MGIGLAVSAVAVIGVTVVTGGAATPLISGVIVGIGGGLGMKLGDAKDSELLEEARKKEK